MYDYLIIPENSFLVCVFVHLLVKLMQLIEVLQWNMIAKIMYFVVSYSGYINQYKKRLGCQTKKISIEQC